MTTEAVDDADEDGYDKNRSEAVEDMHRSVGEFVSRYGILFPRDPKPKGKLSAFFEWKSSVLAVHPRASSEGDWT